MPNSHGGHSGEELRERETTARDSALTFTYCAFCPDWNYYGTAGEGREKAAKHREKEHPGVKRTTRRGTRSLHGFRQRVLDEQEWQAINDERKARARLTGVVLED